MKTGLRDSGPYWVEDRVEVAGLGIIEICGNKIQGAVPTFNAGEMFQSQEAESEAKCDLCLVTGDQMVWTGVGCAER